MKKRKTESDVVTDVYANVMRRVGERVEELVKQGYSRQRVISVAQEEGFKARRESIRRRRK